MKVILVAGLLLTTPCWAVPMNLTYGQGEEVLGALQALSAGQDVLVKDHTIKQPYRGWKLDTILGMTKDIRALEPALRAFDDAKMTKARELAGPNGQIPQDALVKLMKEVGEKKEEKMGQMDLQVLQVGDLNVEANSIPPAVLAALGPLLDMGSPVAAAGK